MQKLLNKTEGTQKTADPSAEKQSVEQNDAENVIKSAFICAYNGVLERTQGAGTACSGAGVAVKSGSTDTLNVARVDLSRGKALQVCVEKQSGIYLYKLSFGGLMRFEPIFLKKIKEEKQP